jgi:bisanhydrobacterioruberin hydratase
VRAIRTITDDDESGCEDVTEVLSHRVPRRRVESVLEETVLDNRFTIAVTFPLVGVALLIAGRHELLPPELAMNPYLIIAANLVMVSPLIAGLLPLVTRRVLAGLAALAAFTWGIELAGVLTGYPYGEFSYQLDLGPMLFDLVPLGLPVFYFPILLNSFLLVLLFAGEASLPRRFALTLACVITLDLILDPGAVALGFWAWDSPGLYYGVPAINYAGWVLSGAVAVSLLHLAFDRETVRHRLAECPFLLDDLVSFLLFWGLVNLYFGNWVPFALALGLAGVLVRSDWFDFDVLPRGALSPR